MGDSETGGGGSVVWRVDANNATKVRNMNKGTRHSQTGHDKDQGDWFTVSISVPRGVTAKSYLKKLGFQIDSAENRVFLNVPIRRDAKQIRVSWGNSPFHLGRARKPPGAKR